jgi:hypothetical protein
MSAGLMSEAWAAEIQALLRNWPDDTEKADQRKSETYWKYYHRHRESFDGSYALGIRGIPGRDDTPYVAITWGPDGSCANVSVLPKSEALAVAKIAMECSYEDWLSMVNGYDISKAMTYHQLPLTKGGAMDLLRCVYFVHEQIAAIVRLKAALPEPAAA